jgi:hypothetical protein
MHSLDCRLTVELQKNLWIDVLNVTKILWINGWMNEWMNWQLLDRSFELLNPDSICIPVFLPGEKISTVVDLALSHGHSRVSASFFTLSIHPSWFLVFHPRQTL